MDKTTGVFAITTVMTEVQKLVDEISKKCLEIGENTGVPSCYVMEALTYALGFSAVTVKYIEEEIGSEE